MQARFRDASDKLRSRADLTAKAIGGIGSTVLAAVGISKLGDLFPFPEDDRGAIVAAALLILSFGAMASVVAFFTVRLWRLNEPIVLSSDPTEMSDLRGQSEIDEVEKIYKQTADLNRVPSLTAYVDRAHRLERMAERTDDETAKRYRTESEQIVNEVLATEARGGLVVIRRRSSNVIRDKWAFLFFAMFVIAVLVFAASADALDGKRAGEITVAKSCADAKEAGALDWPEICDQYLIPKGDSSAEVPATPAQEADQTLESVAAAYVRCRAAARSQHPGSEECEPIRRALLELTAMATGG